VIDNNVEIDTRSKPDTSLRIIDQSVNRAVILVDAVGIALVTGAPK
jgi:hypothetical protein